MKPVWKWIIGIVVGLVVLAAVVGGVILVRNYLPSRHMAFQVQRVQPVQPSQPGRPVRPGQPSQPGQSARPGQPSQPGQPARPFGNRYAGGPGVGMRGYGMRGWGLMPLGGFLGSFVAGFFGGLFTLGVLAFLALGIIWLVRNTRPQRQAVEMHTCITCGKPVQPDWRNCPYCGKKQ